MSLLGLDVGTTGCKAVVFDVDGKVIAQTYREYPLLYPREGWIELDPNTVWEALASSIRVVSDASGHDPIQALSVSSQSEAVMPIAKDGQVLAPSIVTFDNRAIDQSQKLEHSIGHDRFFHISGHSPHPMGTINKIMWWRENRPDIYQRTWKFLCYEDFVFYKLGLKRKPEERAETCMKL